MATGPVERAPRAADGQDQREPLDGNAMSSIPAKRVRDESRPDETGPPRRHQTWGFPPISTSSKTTKSSRRTSSEAFSSLSGREYNSPAHRRHGCPAVYDVTASTTTAIALLTKNPQYQGNMNASKFFNTGKVNHELKFGFNYRRQVNDSSRRGRGSDPRVGVLALAMITRGVRSI